MKSLISLVILFLAVSAHALPAKYRYRCYPKDKLNEKVNLLLQGRYATLDGERGEVDSSYSGGASEMYDRFVGFEPKDGDVELLVEKKLREGASRGRLRIQVRGEGFWVDLYQCYSRD